MNNVEQFQSYVVKNGGYLLSDGTCNLLHLLPKAYDFLELYNIENEALKQAIIECFIPDKDYFETVTEAIDSYNSLFTCQYYGKIHLNKEDYENKENNNYVWHEDVFHFFNNISPDGYYFGGQESDGACIGWFKYENEEEDEEEM